MKVIELLSSEEKWTQRVFARDSEGCGVQPQSTKAVRWCVVGAIECCYRNIDDAITVTDMLFTLFKAEFSSEASISLWQDVPTREYSEVRRLLLLLAEVGY